MFNKLEKFLKPIANIITEVSIIFAFTYTSYNFGLNSVIASLIIYLFFIYTCNSNRNEFFKKGIDTIGRANMIFGRFNSTTNEKFEEAAKYFKKSMEMYSDAASCLGLSFCYIRLGKYSEAKEILESAITRYKKNDFLIFNLAICEEQLLNFDKSVEYYEMSRKYGRNYIINLLFFCFYLSILSILDLATPKIFFIVSFKGFCIISYILQYRNNHFKKWNFAKTG